MVSRDYTKELGLKPTTKKVSWPITVVILAAVAGLVWFGVAKLQTGAHSQDAPHADAATAAATGQVHN